MGRLSIFMLNSAAVMDLKSLTDKSIAEIVCWVFFFFLYQRDLLIEELSLKIVVQKTSKSNKKVSDSIVPGY